MLKPAIPRWEWPPVVCGKKRAITSIPRRRTAASCGAGVRIKERGEGIDRVSSWICLFTAMGGERISLDCFPFETFAAFACRTWSGGTDCHRTRLVRLGGEVAVIDQRHEHGVAVHEVDPLERFRIARVVSGEVFQYNGLLIGRGRSSIGRLKSHTPFAEINDLKEGLEMVEEKARSELGMVKSNEIYVQVAK